MFDLNLSATFDIGKCRAATDHYYLALTIYREARGESVECRVAVGCSILNRVARPSWWGASVNEVVTKRWQYSSLTDPKDPQLSRAWPTLKEKAWQECWEIARLLLADQLPNPVPGADSYYDVSISAPPWTAAARRVTQIGKIVFWDVDHDYQEV